jgi:hypothetical protein
MPHDHEPTRGEPFFGPGLGPAVAYVLSAAVAFAAVHWAFGDKPDPTPRLESPGEFWEEMSAGKRGETSAAICAKMFPSMPPEKLANLIECALPSRSEP